MPFHVADGFRNETLYVASAAERRAAATHPGLLAFHVTDAGTFPVAANHYRERPQGCRESILIVCRDGEGSVEQGRGELSVTPGTFAILPRNLPHRYFAATQHPWTIQWFHFFGVGDTAYYHHLPVQEQVFPMDAVTDRETAPLFKELLSILADGFTTDHLLAASAVAAYLLSRLTLNNPALSNCTNGRYGPAVTAALQAMQASIHRPAGVAEFAAAAGLSPSRFNEVFRRTLGYSPMSYFTRMKISHACHYLESTRDTIGEIAARLGYQDSLYFSRVFRKETGVPPSRYGRRRTG